MAIRAPNHPVALALLRAVGRPVAAPSANPSTQLSPTRAEHVVKGLGGRVDLVLDAGPCALGIESTVVDATRDPPLILRPGSLSMEDIARIAPNVRLHRDDGSHEAHPRPSPGMEQLHYAPRAKLTIVSREALPAAVAEASNPVGLITIDAPLGAPGVMERVLPGDAASYGAELFAALHALDDAGCVSIIVQAPPDTPAWMAIRDRLVRGSAKG
jgi:L-threonylcarbamoyladenylate synthase